MTAHAEMIEKSLLELDFASLMRRKFTPSPAAWEDQVLYFLLLDRFSDGNEKGGYRDNADRRVESGTTPLHQPGTLSRHVDSCLWKFAAACHPQQEPQTGECNPASSNQPR